jgi:hypothetical protein
MDRGPVGVEAAWTDRPAAGAVARSAQARPQQALYRFPLPHGHAAFRAGFYFGATRAGPASDRVPIAFTTS